MRVGLNLVFMGEHAGGVGRYAEELAAAMCRSGSVELTCFVNRRPPAGLVQAPWAAEVRWTRLPVSITGPPAHLLAQFCAVPAIALRQGLDVVHSPANVGPVHMPRVASVVTLLDLIWLHDPEGWGTGRAARSARRLSLACARSADRVLAISHAAAADIVATVGLDPARLDVAPLGVRRSFAAATAEAELRARLNLADRPIVLSVAQKRPYKNLAALIRALVALEPAMLVLPGEPTAHESELRELARALGVADRVRFPPWVSDADLEGLYALSACFALPSRIEGFGLPVLEAMARGVPVVCSNRGALAEVAGDAALVVDPNDPHALTRALRSVLFDRDRAAELARRGRKRALRYSWDATADATLASYERALAARR